MLYINNLYIWNIHFVCFCVLKIFIKNFLKKLFFILLQINIFLMFLDFFDTLILKINLKK